MPQNKIRMEYFNKIVNFYLTPKDFNSRNFLLKILKEKLSHLS